MATAVAAPERIVAGFASALRAAGLAVPVGSVIVFAEALGKLGVRSRESVYWSGMATMVRRPEDIETYRRVFDAFWLGAASASSEPQPAVSVSIALDTGDDGAEGPQADERPREPVRALRWSAVETLRHKDFAAYTSGEWEEYHQLVAALGPATDTRVSRRLSAGSGPHGRPDLRRTLRSALRTGGEPIDRAWREPSRRPRRLLLALDVSGSMEPYARALLRFAHAAVGARRRSGCEVMTLGTRLTRVTRELSARDPDAALDRAAGAVADWSGGTRLGEALGELNDRFGVRGMARGAVVVILSDGWDRGDPEALGEQMARLRRVAARIVWVNPLKASPGFAPLARGMAAALPYVDDFVEGHSLAALQRLAAVIARPGGARSTEWTGERRPVG